MKKTIVMGLYFTLLTPAQMPSGGGGGSCTTGRLWMSPCRCFDKEMTTFRLRDGIGYHPSLHSRVVDADDDTDNPQERCNYYY